MFDGKAFGQEIVAVVKEHIERSLAPLHERIIDLEKQLAEQPKPKDGEPGKSITVEDVAPLIADEVAKAVATIPAPKDGDPGKDADPELIKTMVAEAVAALPPAEKGRDADPVDMERMVAEHVQRAVAAMPVPNDGKDGAPGANGKDGAPGTDGQNGKDGRNGLDAVKFFRDDRGHLIVVKSDGSTDDLGEYVGKDGAAGERGKDGIDGVGFDDMSCEVRDDGVYLVWEKGDLVKEARLPIPMDKGVFKEGQSYRAGDGVTWAGSFWIAQEPTTDKPDSGKGWRLAIKKGRDGKDAPSTKPDPKKGK